MKNTEIAFCSFKQFGYLQLHIRSNWDLVEVLRFFSMYLKDNTFKYLKNQSFIWQFGVTFQMYLDTGGDDDDVYEITLCRHCVLGKPLKNMGNVLEKIVKKFIFSRMKFELRSVLQNSSYYFWWIKKSYLQFYQNPWKIFLSKFTFNEITFQVLFKDFA